MKIEKGPQKFSGQVKFTRGLSGKESCPKYRTGSVVLTQKDKGWILEVHLDVSENAVLCLMVCLIDQEHNFYKLLSSISYRPFTGRQHKMTHKG